MLVLTRRVDESIIIGKNLVEITVLSVSGKAVRLGIHAPPDLSLPRHEVYERILNGVSVYHKPKALDVDRYIEQPVDLENCGNK